MSNFFNKIKNNTDYRIKFFLLLSLLFNTTYACFLYIVGNIYSSSWFLVMAIYYGLLSCIRAYIFRIIINPEKILSQKNKAKTMRTCGFSLLLINIVVSVLIFILIYRHTPIKHHEITVITLAVYSFAFLSIAIVGSIKFIKKNDYLYTSLKLIMLVSASISMVTLTNTMLASFGESNEQLRMIILPILSAFVSILIIFTAITMIVKSNKKLRTLHNEKERQ